MNHDAVIMFLILMLSMLRMMKLPAVRLSMILLYYVINLLVDIMVSIMMPLCYRSWYCRDVLSSLMVWLWCKVMNNAVVNCCDAINDTLAMMLSMLLLPWCFHEVALMLLSSWRYHHAAVSPVNHTAYPKKLSTHDGCTRRRGLICLSLTVDRV